MRKKTRQDKETTVVAIRMPNDQFALFEEKSHKMDVPVSTYVRLFINRSLRRFNETPELMDKLLTSSKDKAHIARLEEI